MHKAEKERVVAELTERLRSPSTASSPTTAG